LNLRQQLGIKDDEYVIVYMGSFFYFSGLPQAIREFARHSDARPKIKFLLIGMGEQDSELRNLVRDLGLQSQVLFAGYVPYELLPKFLSSCDIAINTLEPTLVSHSAFPNKVLQYLASNLPVVSTRLDGLVGVFGDHEGIEWASSPQDAMKLAVNRIEKLGRSNSKPNANSELLRKTFSPSDTVERFEASLRLLKESGVRK
jgi:glycosyltransferase involved in cell wall biosynthesis